MLRWIDRLSSSIKFYSFNYLCCLLKSLFLFFVLSSFCTLRTPPYWGIYALKHLKILKLDWRIPWKKEKDLLHRFEHVGSIASLSLTKDVQVIVDGIILNTTTHLIFGNQLVFVIHQFPFTFSLCLERLNHLDNCLNHIRETISLLILYGPLFLETFS